MIHNIKVVTAQLQLLQHLITSYRFKDYIDIHFLFIIIYLFIISIIKFMLDARVMQKSVNLAC